MSRKERTNALNNLIEKAMKRKEVEDENKRKKINELMSSVTKLIERKEKTIGALKLPLDRNKYEKTCRILNIKIKSDKACKLYYYNDYKHILKDNVLIIEKEVK